MAAFLTVVAVRNRNTNCFVGSGRTPAARFSQELILRRKGGSGSAYWSDPSLAFGELSNFSYDVGRKIEFKQLLQEKGDVIGPYCVDDERRQIVFVETEPGFDPAFTGPFYFQSQRNNAIKVYTVPYEEYIRVIDELPKTHTNNVLLVYNTSRCGSTLLSQCLDKINGMQSISEPDVLTSLTHIAAEAKNTRDEELKTLARASIKLLCHLRRNLHPERDGVCIKFRFQMVYIADLVHKAVPDAKAVFLYRDGLDVIDSMGAAFINTGSYKIIRGIGLDILYVFHLSSLMTHLWKLMPLIRDKKRFPISCYKAVGAVSPFIFSWMSVMTYAMEAYNCKILDGLIRYEELIKGKTDYVIKMLGAVGLDVPEQETDLSHAKGIFSRDSHGRNSITTSKRNLLCEKTGKKVRKGFTYLQDYEVEVIKDVFSRHGEITTADFIIPGTIMAE